MIQQERDAPSLRVPIAALVGSIVIAALSGFVCAKLVRPEGASGRFVEEPPRGERLIADERPGVRERAASERALSSWGWVDREKGIVRIPIERAMEIVAEEDRP